MPLVTHGGHRGLIDSTIFAERNGASVFDLRIFGEDHQERLKRYRQFWRLYKGLHWNYDRGNGGDPDTEPFVTLNYAKRVVDVHVNFLMKSGWDITIPDDPETPEIEGVDRAFIKHELDRNWRYNEKEFVSFEMAQVGSITGDAFVHVFWDDGDPLAPPFPRAEILPTHFCFPEYGSPDGTNRKRMMRMTIALPTFEDTTKLTIRGRIREKQLVMYSRVITPETIELWRDGELIGEEINPFGEINVVHIPNYPVAGEPYGLSDLQVIADLQKSINETATDIQDVIAYYGSPTTIITGARVSELEKGAGRVWSLPADADAKNLELEGDLKASNDYLDRLMEAVYDLTGTTKSSLGGVEKITGTSGATLAMHFLPLLEIRKVKEHSYGRGIRHINRLMLKACELKKKSFRDAFTEIPKETRYFTDIAWGAPLPRDEANLVDLAIKKVEAGLSTRKRELMAMGHSEAEASSILDEWRVEEEEMTEAAVSMKGFAGAMGAEEVDDEDDDGDDKQENRSGNPNPKRPNPDVQGEAVSRKAQVGPDTPK